MDALLITAGLAIFATAIYAIPMLLSAITEWGGDRDDALDEAARFTAESNAYRGNVSPADAKQDGKRRIAKPTQDGGAHIGF